MSVSLTINGTAFSYPELGDSDWGVQATLWAVAATQGMLQKAGGTFTLTAEVDFGATYGLKTAYYKTQTANNSSTGNYRLAESDSISWRNNANSGDLALAIDNSNVLTFNGEVIPAGLIVNADVDAAAAIAFSKMAALTASRALVSDGSGVVTVSSATSTEAGYLSGVTSAIQTQLTARLPLAGGTMTGDLFLAGSPTVDNQAANKLYVDNASAGNVNNFTVRLASTANVVIATALENGDTLDGTVIATGDAILLKNQTSTPENGIYIAPASGAASRSTGMDTWTEAIGASVFVTAGTAGAGTLWKFNTAAGGTLGSTAIPIVQSGVSQVYSASGEGIELSGTTFSLELDGTTLSKSGTGLKVNEIANTQIAAAAAIAVNKLAALTASRAVVSDGSGFVSAATTTSTEIGYVNGVTSAIQTQLDAKIANTLTSSTGDMIYASSANTPARLAVGTSTYILQSSGTIPVWTDQKISFVRYKSTDSSLTIPTSWTTFTLGSSDLPAGSPWTNATNDLTAIYTGIHLITVQISNVVSSNTRNVMVRLRNTTDSTTTATGVACSLDPFARRCGMVFQLQANISNVSKVYQIQVATDGSGVSANQQTVDSQASNLWTITIERIRQ